MARREELEAFLAAGAPAYSPVLPPELADSPAMTAA
jgi:hypothetical protein